jgi:hypothetical protein
MTRKKKLKRITFDLESSFNVESEKMSSRRQSSIDLSMAIDNELYVWKWKDTNENCRQPKNDPNESEDYRSVTGTLIAYYSEPRLASDILAEYDKEIDKSQQ